MGRLIRQEITKKRISVSCVRNVSVDNIGKIVLVEAWICCFQSAVVQSDFVNRS